MRTSNMLFIYAKPNAVLETILTEVQREDIDVELELNEWLVEFPI